MESSLRVCALNMVHVVTDPKCLKNKNENKNEKQRKKEFDEQKKEKDTHRFNGTYYHGGRMGHKRKYFIEILKSTNKAKITGGEYCWFCPMYFN